MKLTHYYLSLMLLVLTSFSYAEDLQAVKTKLQQLMPGVTIESINTLANTQLYEVVINGSNIIYLSKDLNYGFQGNVIELDSGINITQAKKASLLKNILAELDESQLIVYSPEKTQYTLTIFTDIDCGYCRKLHQQMAEYNALGIKIRYLAFPRSGHDSESFYKAENVWCSADKRQAMTDAKNGISVNAQECANPVAAHYQLGQKMGVTGTPALFLESGELIAGYVPPKRLKKMLDEAALARD